MTPGQAIRRFCLGCVGSAAEVRRCGGNRMLGNQGDEDSWCYFYEYRIGKGRPSVKLIRKFCLECQGGSRKLVRECPNCFCPLYVFRMGRNPNYTRRMEKSESLMM